MADPSQSSEEVALAPADTPETYAAAGHEAPGAVATETLPPVQQPVEAVMLSPEAAERLSRDMAIDAALWRGTQNWLSASIHGSAVSRSTEAYNHLVASLPALRDFIKREF